MKKKLEGVIVCVNYGDILAHTLPHNRHYFDDLIVVTDLWDDRTRAVCEFWDVKCITTNLFYDQGDIFNKGNGINVGLKHMSLDSWVVQLDADIFLPPQFRKIFEILELDKNCLYGCDRWMINSYDEWMQFYCCPRPMHQSFVYTLQNTFTDKGCRVSSFMNDGFYPIGFFQLWNPKQSNIWLYPNEHGEANRTDMTFSKYWQKTQRRFIPEFTVAHLESEPAEMGMNWRGRKSKTFGVEVKPIVVNFEVFKYKKAETIMPGNDIGPLYFAQKDNK